MGDLRYPKPRHAELVSTCIFQSQPMDRKAEWTLKQVQGDGVCFGG
jgi:hypothetical protein